VVAGRLSAADLAKAVKDGGGSASLKTVEGDSLKVTETAGGVAITDDKGDVAKVAVADVFQSNGVIHVIDAVLLP
jgi:uncharacterized surface protein with fasciclin (FAS1) repeats